MKTTWISLALIYFTEMLDSAYLQPSIEYTAKNFYINLHNKYGTQNNITQEKAILDEILLFNKNNEKLYRKKRDTSHHTIDIDSHLLQENGKEMRQFKQFLEAGQVPVPNAKWISLFSHNNVDKSMTFHAVTLQDDYETMGDFLKLYKYAKNQESWILISTENIIKSSKVYSVPESDGTLLVVTHNCAPSSSSDGSTVLYLDDNSRLQKIQSLKTCPYSDVLLWRADYTFLAFARDHAEIKDSVLFETDSSIYVWKGKHFDFLQNFSTSNAKKLTALQIGSSHYLAVANHQNNYGEKKIFSEVFKYDAHEEKFVCYQKLASNAAVDINFFSFLDGSYEESYLLIANEYTLNSHNEIGSHAVIYKLEDDIFVPFQSLYVTGITRWISIVGLPGEFFLLAVSEINGFNVFQHNGWHFVDVPYERNAWFQNPGRKVVKTLNFYGKPMLVIADQYNDGSFPNLYYPIFDIIKPTQQMNDQLLSWCSKVQALSSCTEELHDKKYNKIDKLLKIIKHYHILESNQLQVNKNVHLNLALIGKINTNALFANDINLDSTVIQNINKLYKMFDFQLSSLKSLEEIFPNTMCDDSNIYIDSIHIKNLEFDCASQPCILNDVEILKLNHKDMIKYQKEVFYTEYVYDFYDEIIFESLTVEENFDVAKINERSIENVDLFIQELAKVAGVIVDGNVFLSSGVSVAGLLDGIKISEEFILLNDADQNLIGTFAIPVIQTVLLEANEINDLSSKAIREIVVNENKTTSSSYFLDKLTVDEAFIEGLINIKNIDTINANALRLSGDQDIDGISDIAIIETLEVLVSPSSEQPVMDNFISIKDGSFEIEQDLQFDNVNTPNIIIKERLNSVPVTDGELSLLMLDSAKMQRITGEKVFQNVELMGPITLRGQINSRSLEKKNPVVLIEEPLILTGNFIIQGNVSIERILECENLISGDNTQTVKHLQQRGLKLTDDRILMPLFFSQPLEVRSIDCDTINGINPMSWISSQEDNMKTISGKKTFLSDLNIEGNCAITETLNEINPTLLDRDTLKVSGDQDITGKMFFSNLTTKGLNSQNVSFGAQSFDQLLTLSRDRIITGEMNILNGAAIHEILSAGKIDVTGTTAGFFINDLFEDTVMTSSKMSEINSNIIFHEELNIKSLDLLGISGINIQKLLLSENWNKEILFDEPLYINKNVAIRDITFDISIAGISKVDFGNSWLLSDDSQVFHGNQFFTDIICNDGIFVETGKINNYDLSYIFSNIVWLDQDAFFAKIEFKNGLTVYKSLRIDGFINNLTLPQDLIVKRKYTNVGQNVLGHKVMKKNLYISEALYAEYISTVNLEYFCQITLSTNDAPLSSLHISGFLNFAKEPGINKINNFDIDEILSKIWLADEPSTLYGHNFITKAAFENIVNVQESVAGVDLNRLSQYFLSCTLDQHIQGLLEISRIDCSKINVNDGTRVSEHVNGLEFNLFYNNTLKIDGDQTISEPIDFSSIFIKENFHLEGKVNNLNLETDVFRYSGENRNTKHVTLNSAIIKSLSIPKGNLQNVDIAHYSKNVIDRNTLKTTMLRGIKNILYFTSKDLSVSGNINGKKITEENILSKSSLQTISGRKTITSNDDTYFHSANIVKNIKNYNAHDTFTSLINKNSKKVNIKTPKTMKSEIYSNNLVVDGGVNGLDFKSQAKSLGSPKTYKNYDKEYNELINFSYQILSNFEEPAKKIIDMKSVHVIPGEILHIAAMPPPSEKIKSQMAIAFKNLDGLSEICFFYWNPHQHIFAQDFDIRPLVFNEAVTKLFSFTLEGQITLFVEIYDANSNYKILMIAFDEKSREFDLNSHKQFDSNVTASAVSLEPTDQSCVLVSSVFGLSQLYCHEKHGSINDLRWRQSMDIYNSTEMGVLNISGVVHVLISSPNSVQVVRWVSTGRGTLATLQSILAALCIATASFENHHFVAAKHGSIIAIYKFSDDVQRFEKKQELLDMPGAEKLQLITLPGQQLALVILDSKSRIIVYVDAGIAGFQVALTHYAPVSHISNLVSIVTQTGQHLTALATPNQVQIVETIFN